MPFEKHHKEKNMDKIQSRNAEALWVPHTARQTKYSMVMYAWRKFEQKNKFYPDWKLGEFRKMFIKFTHGKTQARSKPLKLYFFEDSMT